MPNDIIINGALYQFEPGETILQVAERQGIFIPTLCFLKGSSPSGACRMCIVEVRGAPGPGAACSTPATHEMEVRTDTPRIIKARKMIVELLLISGNHNCSVQGKYPLEWSDFQKETIDYDRADDICIAYGECKLQALAYRYMVNQRTFDRIPTNYPLEYDDLLIGRDFSRCILCGRCIQACNDIQVNNALSHGYRGNIAKIVAKGDLTLPQSDCVYCGECVQACPVGSLFPKRNRFSYRMWDVTKVQTTCFYCGVGCQMELTVQNNQILKVDGIESAEPNRGRLCFKGRFGFDFLHSNKRLTKPLVRESGKLIETTWEEVLALIISKMKKIKEESKGSSIGCFLSPKFTNEDLFQAKKFFHSILESDRVTHFEPVAFFDMPYEEIFNFSTIIVSEIDLPRENPVAATFVKQAVKAGSKLVVVDKRETELSPFASVCLDSISELKKEISSDTLMIVGPDVDLSSIEKTKNMKIVSFNRENNTLGTHMLGLIQENDIQMSYLKFIYDMGNLLTTKDNSQFVVVQGVFKDETYDVADVVLPTAVWVEYDGTYVGSDFRINRVRKALTPPGEARPPWMIFRELAKKMGHQWQSENPQQIWDDEILKENGDFVGINYDSIKDGGQPIKKPEKLKLGKLVAVPSEMKRPDFHKIYCEKCKNLDHVIQKRFKEIT